MKRLLALLMLCVLALPAWADGPDAFSAELQALSDADFAARCEASLADTSLAGSVVVTREEGSHALTRNEYYAFAAMYRPDGLMMLCHFVPEGDGVVLDWHNDLLLSYYQDIALSTVGTEWSGGQAPGVILRGSFELEIVLFQRDSTQLALTCEPYADGWRVTKMVLLTSPDGVTCHASLILTEDCLAEDIFLATCVPNDWRRGEMEEDVTYGW